MKSEGKERQDSQELMLKFAIFEEQIRQIQEQNAAIEKAIFDSEALVTGLDELKNAKDKEIFASIGRGIFIKSKIASDKLIVDIGNKNFVEKGIIETQEIIKNQLIKLEDARNQLQENLNSINQEVDTLIKESQ